MELFRSIFLLITINISIINNQIRTQLNNLDLISASSHDLILSFIISFLRNGIRKFRLGSGLNTANYSCSKKILPVVNSLMEDK